MGAECLQGMRPHVEAALAGKPMERDAEVVHKKLGRRWIHVDCVPTFDRTGAPDGWIEAITDVTEQRRTEQSLQENRRTLQSFYDSSPFFMGLVELDGDSIVFLSANQALARGARDHSGPDGQQPCGAVRHSGRASSLGAELPEERTRGRAGAVRLCNIPPVRASLVPGNGGIRRERRKAAIQLRGRGDH